jgi:hypothetical protein
VAVAFAEILVVLVDIPAVVVHHSVAAGTAAADIDLMAAVGTVVADMVAVGIALMVVVDIAEDIVLMIAADMVAAVDIAMNSLGVDCSLSASFHE